MIINKDLTKESVCVFVSQTQIYARIFHKHHGKWEIETYFKDYGFEVDQELVQSTIRYIQRLWGLHNSKVTVHK